MEKERLSRREILLIIYLLLLAIFVFGVVWLKIKFIFKL